MVTVSLLTNDEHGNDTGRVSGVTTDNGGLELAWGDFRNGPKYRIERGFLYLSRQRFAIKGSKEWYGNWCWTGVWMNPDEAAKLLNYLSKDDRWHCEGGFCDLADAYCAGKVTAELLNEA